MTDFQLVAIGFFIGSGVTYLCCLTWFYLREMRLISDPKSDYYKRYL